MRIANKDEPVKTGAARQYWDVLGQGLFKGRVIDRRFRVLNVHLVV